MPIVSSQSSAAAVRRAHRRKRRIANRARTRPHFPRSSSTPVNRRHSRRHQSRDPALYLDDDCFTIRQDRVSDRDPDFHLGSGVRIDANQFAVLEQDVPCPSSPPSFPVKDFTFSYPSPCTSLKPESTVPAAEVPASAAPTPSGKLLLRPWRRSEAFKVNSPTTPSSPLLPSIPNTPYAEPRIKLPGSFPDFQPFSQPIAHTLVGTGYLDGIRIPSPLLYHKRSRELLERSSDHDINAELAKIFSLTCGRDIPEPDFESYKPFEEITEARTTPVDQPGFIAARLPGMEPSVTELRPSCNIPHRPWVEQSKQMSSSSTWPSIFTNTSTTTPMGASLLKSDSGTTAARPSRSGMPANSQQKESLALTNLVFPRLNVPNHCFDSWNKIMSPGLWEPPAKKPEFIDDDPVTVLQRWTAFENAILHPKRVERRSSTLDRSCAVFKSDPADDIAPHCLHEAGPAPSTAAVAMCPTSTCMALVPARLYEHQYICWPRRPAQEPEYSLASYPIFGSPLVLGPELDNMLRMTEWFEELGFERQHRPRCPLATDVSTSFDEDFKIASESETADVPSRACSHGLRSASESSETTPVEIEDDEGYFTCQESGSEIGVDEAALSDVEWADWDWEPEIEQMQDAGPENDGDADVDAFGIGWGF